MNIVLMGVIVMKLTVLELFNLVIQGKSAEDFFSEDARLEMEDYLLSVTSFAPNEKIVIASNCHDEPLNVSADIMAHQLIDVDGLMVYYYIWHDDEFYFKRIKDDRELMNIMKCCLYNSFIGDFIVFENGKKKKYCVKNEKGQIIHKYSGDSFMKEDLFIEWY